MGKEDLEIFNLGFFLFIIILAVIVFLISILSSRSLKITLQKENPLFLVPVRYCRKGS